MTPCCEAPKAVHGRRGSLVRRRRLDWAGLAIRLISLFLRQLFLPRIDAPLHGAGSAPEWCRVAYDRGQLMISAASVEGAITP